LAITSRSRDLQGGSIARTDLLSSTFSAAQAGLSSDGSPIVAFKQGKQSAECFATIEISDVDPELLAAATTRLQKLEAPVRATPGPAVEAISNIVSSLNQYGLHFALLDPHNLGALSFSIIGSCRS
jgi:hypothetical protein